MLCSSHREKNEKKKKKTVGLKTVGWRQTAPAVAIDGHRCLAVSTGNDAQRRQARLALLSSFSSNRRCPSLLRRTSSSVDIDRRRSPAMLVSHRRFLPFIAVLRRTSTSVDIVRRRSPATLVSHRRFLRFIAVSIVTQFFSSYIKII